MVAIALATSLPLFASSAVLMAKQPSPVDAAAAPLAVSVDRSLSLVGEAITLSIAGQSSESLVGTRLVVRIKGPAELSQVGQITPELPEANKLVITLDAPPSTTTTSAGGPATAGSTTTTEGATTATTQAATTTTVSSTTTTTVAAKIGTVPQLEAGVLDAEVVVPGAMPARAGAYLLVVEVKTETEVVAIGQTWVGKAEPRETPLDLALVWPLSLGIHRGPDGVYYDRVLEKAVTPTASGAGDLRTLLGLSGAFTDWNFTLAVEPVLLTQLRDMADGYVRHDPSSEQVDVSADDPAAKSATEVLTALKGLGGDESVEVAVSPYSGADLGVLAAQGWRDGFEQIQMGKQEIQQTMGLQKPLIGAYSPDLDLTTDSVVYYAQASIDHVLVDAGLTELLAEPVAEGTIAVRARDAANDRVTLVFANSGLSSHMTAPWDPNVFFAALAAELTRGDQDAIVVTPRVEFALVPEAYLRGIGQTLETVEWIETRTITALLREHSPDMRPILLRAESDQSRGYIEESLLGRLQEAHAVVSDLALIADATQLPVEAAHRSLYMAESRWWSRPETSPQEANTGLEYVNQAKAAAEGELAKIHLLGVESTVMMGGEGVVNVSLENKADYPFTVELHLHGTGVAITDGEVIDVELMPGRTDIPVEVVKEEGSPRIDVTLVAGDTTLDSSGQSLRFITVMTVLPWVIIGAAVVAAALLLLARWLWRRRAPRAA